MLNLHKLQLIKKIIEANTSDDSVAHSELLKNILNIMNDYLHLDGREKALADRLEADTAAADDSTYSEMAIIRATEASLANDSAVKALTIAQNALPIIVWGEASIGQAASLMASIYTADAIDAFIKAFNSEELLMYVISSYAEAEASVASSAAASDVAGKAFDAILCTIASAEDLAPFNLVRAHAADVADHFDAADSSSAAAADVEALGSVDFSHSEL